MAVHKGVRGRHSGAAGDVTGAGDTVVGTLTLALAAKVPILHALKLASHAASIAVGRPGTVAVTTEELLASFSGA